MLLRKLSSHFDSYNYCHKIIKVSFGKHNVGRCILSQSKGLSPKNFPGGFAPRPLHSSTSHIICPRNAAAKYSLNSPNCALLVSVSSKGPASTSCPGARPGSRRPWLNPFKPMSKFHSWEVSIMPLSALIAQPWGGTRPDLEGDVPSRFQKHTRSLYQNRENRYPSRWHVPVPKICIVTPPPGSTTLHGTNMLKTIKRRKEFYREIDHVADFRPFKFGRQTDV